MKTSSHLAAAVAAVAAAPSLATAAVVDPNGAALAYFADDTSTLSDGDASWQPTVGQGNLDISGPGYVVNGPDVSPGTAIDRSANFAGARALRGNLTQLSNRQAGTATVEMWIQPDALVGDQTLIEIGGGNLGFGLALQGDEVVLVATGSDTLRATLGAGATGDFVQVVGVKDSVNGELELYLDGALAASGAASGGFAGTDGTSVGAGGNNQVNGLPAGDYTGDLAFLRIYDSALDASEVSNAFNAVVPEPASAALLAAGSLLVLGRRRG